MTAFDPEKALLEELTGLAGVKSTLTQRMNAAQQKMVEAEDEFNALGKLVGFVNDQLTDKRGKLNKLREG